MTSLSEYDKFSVGKRTLLWLWYRPRYWLAALFNVFAWALIGAPEPTFAKFPNRWAYVDHIFTVHKSLAAYGMHDTISTNAMLESLTEPIDS